MKEDLNDGLENIYGHLKDVLDLKVKDAKLIIIEVMSLFFAHISSAALLIGLILICILFLSLGLGLYLNEVLNSRYMGFFLVAAVFVVSIGVVLLIQKNRGLPFFANTFVKLMVKTFYYGEKRDKKSS